MKDDNPEWLKTRRGGIGGSDAAALAGLNPWKSPFALWHEKMGDIQPNPPTERMQMGRVMEPVILDLYEQETGQTVYTAEAVAGWLDLSRELWDAHVPLNALELLRHVKEHTTLIYGPDEDGRVVFANKERPWQRGEVDAFVHHPEKGWGLVEAKQSERGRSEWESFGVPDYYVSQGDHYMDLFGLFWADFAVLFNGNHFDYQTTDRNEDRMLALRGVALAFYESMTEGVPPEPDGSDSTADAIKKLYPNDSGESVPLDAEGRAWDEEREHWRAKEKEASLKKKAVETRLRAAIGDATFGDLGNGIRYSYRKIEGKTIPVSFTPDELEKLLAAIEVGEDAVVPLTLIGKIAAASEKGPSSYRRLLRQVRK